MFMESMDIHGIHEHPWAYMESMDIHEPWLSMEDMDIHGTHGYPSTGSLDIHGSQGCPRNRHNFITPPTLENDYDDGVTFTFGFAT